MSRIEAANMDDHLDHARILAFLDAYGRRNSAPMPFNWLVRCVQMARHFSPTSGLVLSARLTERSVRAVLIDTERLGLTHGTSRGWLVTEWGRAQLESWGEKYEQLLGRASGSLGTWGV